MTPQDFRTLPIVKEALKNPRSPRSILNYMCACDTSDPELRKDLSKDEIVSPLLLIWFASGTELDDLCQPFAPVVRELKSNPSTLVGENWEGLEGKVAKVLLADQLSRSCFRGSAEAFSYDIIIKFSEWIEFDYLSESEVCSWLKDNYITEHRSVLKIAS